MLNQPNLFRSKKAFPALDRIDLVILELLQNNARLSNKEIAAQVNLAPSSCLSRIRRLRETKVLQGFHAEINTAAVGIGLQAIVAVRLTRHSRDKFRSLYNHFHGLPEVLQVFHVSGVNDLLLHVAVRDVTHLRDLVVDEIATRSEVANCETSVIFSSFRNSRLPVYAS